MSWQSANRLPWKWIAVFFLVVLLTMIRVAATHRVFSAVVDEPVHIAAGYDWLKLGSMTFDIEHPPLERVLSALPLASRAEPWTKDLGSRGIVLLYSNNHYIRNLAAARRANLAFLVLMLVASGWWALRAFGSPSVALMTVAILGSVPPILGHAGVATTDMAGGATVVLALVLFDRWLTCPTIRRAAMLGLAIGLGMLAKFSFPLFFVSGAIVLLAFRRPAIRDVFRGLALASFVALLVIWAGYRFSIGKLADANAYGREIIAESVPAPFSGAASWIATHVPMPAPAFFTGIAAVRAHNARGHFAYLFGRYSERGWWYYFPVMVLFKTPLPLLVLALCGIVTLIRERNREGLAIIAIAAAFMLAVMPASINIGVRHVLVIYAPLSILAGHAVVAMAHSARTVARLAAGALLLWLFVGVAFAHPDYLAWFNELAGRHPERIASDSNLDWGQDAIRLRQAVRHHRIDTLHVAIVSTAMLDHHGINAIELEPNQRVTGWIALSETILVLGHQSSSYDWLQSYRPVEHVGKSIRLYYLP